MAENDSNFQVVYRGESLTDYAPAGFVFFSGQKRTAAGSG